MKLFNKMKITIFLLVFVMAGVACDHLALEPQQSISTSGFFQTMGDFRAAVNGGYSQMSLASWYGRTMTLAPDIMGEDVKQSAQANRYQEFSDYEGLRITGHQYEVALWREVYDAINQMNLMINAPFEPPAVSQTEYDQLIGEAYAIRALGHFDLVRMFAQHYTFTAGATHPGIPIVTLSDVSNLPPKNTVGEVYSQVISDLNTAVSKMTLTRSGGVTFSKEAAQALLSRVYLYMEDYTNAEAMATTVINSGKYSLVSRANYLNIFSPGNSSEAIMEISNTETDNRGSDSVARMYQKAGYGDYLPAKDLLNLIEPEDIRSEMYIFDPDLTGNFASMRVNKWPKTDSSDNVPVIRLAELYLIRAEARAKTGNEAGALDDLNMIRERAYGDSDHNSSATGQALLDEIAVERRKELAHEGHRLFDITRNKLDLVRVDFTGDVGFIAYPSNFSVFPIPQQETDTNPNLPQNPGY